MSKKNCLILIAACLFLNFVQGYAQQVAIPVLSYTFNQPSDASGHHAVSLEGGASLVKLSDGNHSLFTGPDCGYADLGSSVGETVLGALNGDYSIHIDVCAGATNSLSRFCWAFAFANGTGRYIGLVNAAGNGNWYYEIKNGTASQANSRQGISPESWHSVTVVQSGSTCTIYVDGVVCGTSDISLRPADIAASVSQCWLGRSPFSGDAYMTNTLIDNFQVFDTALSPDDVAALYSQRPTSADIAYSDAEKIAIARKELYAALGVRYIHNRIVLPTSYSQGTVAWTYTEVQGGCLDFTDNVFTVNRRSSEAVQVGTLQGKITISGQAHPLFEEPLPVVVAPDDNAVGYLYCHMPDRVPQPGGATLVSQTITYALGKAEDGGLRYNELNEGNSIIDGIGTTLPWCRDAFLAKDTLRKCYYIVTTDLYGSQNNGTSMLGNYSIGMFRSFDLINWTYHRCDLKQYLRKNPPTDIYDNSGTRLLTANKVSRVWAPQIIMVDGDAYIYYAVGNTDNGDCDHFYISKANAEFSDIESFQMLYGPNKVNNILDADIVYLPTDQLYHMSYRDYEADDIRDITCADLLHPVWSTTPITTFTDGRGFEASSVFRRINDDVWNVGNVNYSSNRGFHFHTADGLLRNLQPAPALSGNLSPQHGSFVMVSQTEWNVLQGWSDLKGLIKRAKTLLARKANSSVRALVTQCERDITTDRGAATDLETLAATIAADVEALRNALAEAYPVLSAEEINTMTVGANEINITNAFFASNADGWTSTPMPAVREGVAEFFAAGIDFSASLSQTLTGLPQGDYLVTCQVFERNGHNDACGHSYAVGSENLHFSLFANTSEVPVPSLYSHAYDGSDALYGYVNGMAGASRLFSQSYDNYLCGVVAHVTANGRLTFGLRSDTHTVHTSDWCCFDNFHVYRLTQSTSVQSPISDHSSPSHLYTIDGRRKEMLQKGINIIVSANGSVQKTFCLSSGSHMQ
jgi:hypothetical protein